MSAVFCDTSALYALVTPHDPNHGSAAAAWPELVDHHDLATTNYVMLETIALLQTRSGLKSVSSIVERISESVEVGWIDEPLHAAALRELLSTNQRRLSFMDCTSFGFMRRHRITKAFAYDPDFARNGFDVIS